MGREDTEQTTRERVLQTVDELDERAVPATLRSVAERMGLPAGTVRWHVEALVQRGVLEAEPVTTHRPGRRPLRYRRASTTPDSGERNYQLLAQVLTGMVRTLLPDSAGASEAAGREWGRYLAERPAPGKSVTMDEAQEQLRGQLAELGFEPQQAAPDEIRLLNCPFRSVAESHREIACAVHLGLMRGLLDETRSLLAVDRLVPFAAPGWCTVHLDRSGGAAPA